MGILQFTASAFLLLTAFLLVHEFAWVLWYTYESRRRNYDVPSRIERSFPLGIRRSIRMLKLFKRYELLQTLTKEFFNSYDSRTILRQAQLHWQIYTLEPENIKSVLATNFNDYSLGVRSRQISPIFGHGIFTLSGGAWKHSRAMLRPQFGKEQISRLETISEHVQTMIEEIKREQAVTNFVDIQEYFHLLTMDTATEFLFGESIESLSPQKHKIVTRSGEEMTSEEFVESYTFLNNYGFKRAVSGKLYWAYNSKEYREHRRRAQAFIDYYVDLALKATAPNEKVREEQDDDSKNNGKVYTFSHELAKITRDPVVIRDQIFNILIAGRDTTASTLSFALYYLARDSQLYEILREEIIDSFGNYEEHREITFESLKQASFLKNFVNEVLRLAPVVPLNFREAIRDTHLPTGGGADGTKPVFVPKGTTVHYSVFMMHRDKSLWGEDADTFRPERWENLKLEHLWSYLPFNGGPRICLGQQFALTEISLTLTRLLQQFERIERHPSFPDEPKLVNSLTLMNAPPGVPIRLS